jgi:hypothetical protein
MERRTATIAAATVSLTLLAGAAGLALTSGIVGASDSGVGDLSPVGARNGTSTTSTTIGDDPGAPVVVDDGRHGDDDGPLHDLFDDHGGDRDDDGDDGTDDHGGNRGPGGDDDYEGADDDD